MKNTRYLFSDIDGTLIFNREREDCKEILDEERFISAETITLLNEIRRQNIKVILVSGRRQRSYDHLSALIPHDGAVLEHGSLILLANDELNQKYHLSLAENIQTLWKFKLFLEDLGYQIDADGRVGSFRVIRLNNRQLLAEDKAVLEEIIKNNSKNFQIHSVRNEQMIDVLPLLASKDRAIQFILNEHHIPMNQAVILGNDNNDLSMFDQAVYGACPADAEPDVKLLLNKKANCYVSPKSSHEGISDILRKYILQI